MRRYMYIVALVGALIACMGQACRCSQEAFCKKAERADYLFQGVVREVHPSEDQVQFVVEAQQMFKAPPGESQLSTIALRSPNGPNGCGMKLAVDDNYLFASDIEFWITSCGASKPWDLISNQEQAVLKAGGLCDDCAALKCNSNQRCIPKNDVLICSDICQPGHCAPNEMCQLVPGSKCGNGPCPDVAVCSPIMRKTTCLHNCSIEFRPVCGSNGITYSNECLLKNAACRDPSIKLQKIGECCSRGCCKFRECRPFSKGEYCTDTCHPDRCPKGYHCRLQKAKSCTPDFCPQTAVCEPACNQQCLDRYSPICGSNGMTFASRCELERAQCQDSGLMTLHRGICSSRDSVCGRQIACPDAYDPLCGSNGVTYPNTCYFEQARCETPNLVIKREGTCEASCDLNCPSAGNPVCSNGGITYANECLLKQAACKHGNIWLKKNGACDKCL